MFGYGISEDTCNFVFGGMEMSGKCVRKFMFYMFCLMVCTALGACAKEGVREECLFNNLWGNSGVTVYELGMWCRCSHAEGHCLRVMRKQ